MTYYDLIRSSLRLIGVLGPGRGPNGSEITDALFVLNSMLDNWATERLIIYVIDRQEYPITSGKSSYTFGPGGDFPDRPVRLESAGLIYSDTESPIQVITQARWAAGGGPRNVGGYEGVYYSKGFPQGTVHLRPNPTSASSFVLYSWMPLTQVVDENVTVEFPPGYADAIRYNLGVRLGLEWGRDVRPEVQALAAETKANIKRSNMEPIEASVGSEIGGCCGSFDIYRGY